MKLIDYFGLEADTEKKELFGKLENFLKSDIQTFILTGYAGTGKTTILKAVADYLTGCKREVNLMASTGRAAKILSDKTLRQATTIHLGIYQFELSKESKGYVHLVFRVGLNFSPENTVYIIDESSMISNRENNPSYATFGSGALLNDIYTYAAGRKIIFVGDIAQLPPIKSDMSPALSPGYLESHFGTKTQSFNLKNIHRQSGETAIYKVVHQFVKIFNARRFNFPNINIQQRNSDIEFFYYESDMIRDFCKGYNQAHEPDRIFLAYSNKKTHSLNMIIRSMLFQNPAELQNNEWLVNFSNNYKYNILNGTGVRFIKYLNRTEYKAGLTFKYGLFEVNIFGNIHKIKAFFIMEYMLSPMPGLSADAEKDLIIDFNIRMSHAGIKPKNKTKYLAALRTDPYLNALRLRYGYALTVHKAQGGEWDNIYLVFERYMMNFPFKLQHNWAYTAVTRARKKLNILNNYFIK